MPATAPAELIPDRGEAAAGDDFFRSRAFLRAEGVTHTLRIPSAGRTAAVPLIVREIPGSDRHDATSPYGYPGAAIEGDGPAPPAEAVDWSGTGLVSVFARERLGGGPWLANPTERTPVQVHDPARPRRIRSRLAGQIRAGERAGWTVESCRGPAATPRARAAFAAAYAETMARTRAAERYLYPPRYFDRLLSHEASWLVLARSPGGEPGAGAIAAVSDGHLHYYLGGTTDAARPASPFKNVVAAMVALADELELPLNLGGGVSPGDGLETFKRGFANLEATFRTHEVICDAATYAELAGDREAVGFFPAYRAPR